MEGLSEQEKKWKDKCWDIALKFNNETPREENSSDLVARLRDLIFKETITARQEAQKDFDKLKDFWKKALDKFENSKGNATNKMALDALSQAFDVYTENEKLKSLIAQARPWVKELHTPYLDLIPIPEIEKFLEETKNIGGEKCTTK